MRYLRRSAVALALVLASAVISAHDRGPWYLIGRKTDTQVYGCTVSPDGARIPLTTSSITDATCHVWTQGPGVTPDIQVWRDGALVSPGATGAQILWLGGVIYLQANDLQWYTWITGYTFYSATDPEAGGCTVTASNTTVPSGAMSITDNACDVWTYSSGTSDILKNGVHVDFGDFILWYSDTIYTFGLGNWYRWSGSAFVNIGAVDPRDTPPGGTYYVSNSGSDAANGLTTGTAWLTLQKAANTVVAGDLVIVRDGTYTSALDQVAMFDGTTGTSGAPIVFRAENKYGAIVDGQSQTTGSGFFFKNNAAYITIQNFEIRNMNRSGIETENGSGTDHLRLVGNKIHHIGRICTETQFGLDGIFVGDGSNNLTAEQNLIYDVGRYGTEQGGCTATANMQQDHAIYVHGVTGLVFRNNVVYDIWHGWGVQMYPGPSTDFQIVNNTFARTGLYRTSQTGHLILSGGMTNGLIANNIFDAPLGGSAFVFFIEGFTSTVARNNLTSSGVVSTAAATGLTLTGNLNNTATGVTNAGANDFSLTMGSAAVNAGFTIGGVTVDFTGRSRPQGVALDIGAYEF